MGKGDNRITKEFDPRRLAELTKATGNASPEANADDAALARDEDHATPVLSVGRTKTLDDPMTTALLVEIAQRSKTADFDRDVIEVLLDAIDNGVDTSQPNVRRRKS